jgi:hypothetical protein
MSIAAGPSFAHCRVDHGFVYGRDQVVLVRLVGIVPDRFEAAMTIAGVGIRTFFRAARVWASTRLVFFMSSLAAPSATSATLRGDRLYPLFRRRLWHDGQ